MIPALPSTNPPCQSIAETLGFQSPHVDMSDQIVQTLSAGAVLSTEVPYSGIARSFLCAGDCRSLSPRRTGPPEIDLASPPCGEVWPAAKRHARVGMGSGLDGLRREVALPEVERQLEVVLGCVAVVYGQVGHREAVSGSRQPLHDSSNPVAAKLLTELVDHLRGDRSIGLGESEVELAADTREVVVG